MTNIGSATPMADRAEGVNFQPSNRREKGSKRRVEAIVMRENIDIVSRSFLIISFLLNTFLD